MQLLKVLLNDDTFRVLSNGIVFNDMQLLNVPPKPGALPVLNKEAVHKAIMLGTALNSKINQVSIFNRKN